MDTSHSVLRFAKRFFSGTILSRLSGVAREMAMAFCFGSAPEIAAFIVAYRLANLFRRLMGEGNLSSSFVPLFETLQGQNREKALFFYREVSWSLLLVLLGVVGALEALLGWGSQFFSPAWQEIAHLAMRMIPGLIFICLYALNAAFLQCHKRYFTPAAAPIFFNLAWIGSAFVAARYPLLEAARILSLGVTIAFACQWITTSLQVKKLLAIPWRPPRLFSSEWKRLLKPLLLGIVGVGAMQLNTALDAIFARLADESGPSYLWFAIRLQQLPLALFGVALSGALLPALSRAMREGAIDRYKSLLLSALRHSAALMIPCTVALFTLGRPAVNLLFGHGQFTPQDVTQTLYCLWGYGLGLLPAVLVLLLATGFYARKSYSLPTLASLFSVLLNIALNALMVFLFKWGAVSIAIGTSVAALLNATLLYAGLQQLLGPFLGRGFGFSCLRILFSSLLAAFVTQMAGIGGEPLPRSPMEQMIEFGGGALFFTASFVAFAYLFRAKEFFEILRRSPDLREETGES